MQEYEAIRKFSEYLQYFDCTRIESHATGNGIPDTFYQGLGIDFWVEFKSNTKVSILNNRWKIDWRPGQCAWAWNYLISHRRIKCTLTILRCFDGFVIIPMCKDTIMTDKWIKREDAWTFKFSELDDLSVRQAFILFRILTEPFTIRKPEKSCFNRSHNETVTPTYRTSAVDWVDKYYGFGLEFDYDIDDLLRTVFTDVDVESEVDKQIFMQHQQNLFKYLESFIV